MATAREVERLIRRRGSALGRAMSDTGRGLGRSAVAYTRKILTEQIYAIPEDRKAAGARSGGARPPARPQRPTGQKKWQRTGALRRGERWEIVDPFTVHIINDVAYAEPRHEAGKPGRRNINPARQSHWRDELLETFAPLQRELYHQTLLDVLAAPQRSRGQSTRRR